MKERIKLVIENNDNYFGPGVAALLKLIDEHGSIQAASSSMNMSYSKAWKIVRHANEALGFPLLISQNGGKEGGKSCLTEEGRCFLKCYEEMEIRLRDEGDRLFRECFAAFLNTK